MLQISEADNPDLAPIIEKMEELEEADTETKLEDSLNVSLPF